MLKNKLGFKSLNKGMIQCNYLSQFIGNYTGWGKDVICLIHFKIYIMDFLKPRPKKLKLLLSQSSYIVVTTKGLEY